MERTDGRRSLGDAVFRLLFPMVSFRDAFWVPMMAAAIPSAPVVVAWCMAAAAFEPDLASMGLFLQALSVAALAASLVPAWYASFILLYCLSFAVVVVLAAGLSAFLWMCDKSAARGRG